MQDIDAHEFGNLLEQVFECYDRKAPSEAAAKMWFRSLKEFMFEDVRKTLLRWINTKSKAPTIAEITSQLQDRTSASLERSAAADKQRFQQGRNLGPTEIGRNISATVRTMLGLSKTRDCKKWAKDLLAIHASGQTISHVQLALATAALGPRRIREPGEDDE